MFPIQKVDIEMIETENLTNELDYIEASIQLGLLEITGELEETAFA